MNWITTAMQESELADAIEECDNRECVETFLRAAGIDWTPHIFANGETYIVANVNNETKIIDPDYPLLKDAYEWIWEITDNQLQNFVGEYDYNKLFWEGSEFVPKLYHRTTRENANQIMIHGLTLQDKTRGISNKGTGSAIFTSTQPMEIPHGSVIIEIDTKSMLSDGYTPTVSLEYPVETELLRNKLAHMIGLEDFYNTHMEELSGEGLFENTIIIFDNIPPIYLKVMT